MNLEKSLHKSTYNNLFVFKHTVQKISLKNYSVIVCFIYLKIYILDNTQ